MRKLEKGKMITNGKGMSYYQLGKRFYRNTGFLRVEISKEEFEDEVDKAFKELENEVNNMEYKIECGKTLEEYMAKYGEAYERGELWDFSAEDINGGAIDLDPNITYWEIDGRVYETSD